MGIEAGPSGGSSKAKVSRSMMSSSRVKGDRGSGVNAFSSRVSGSSARGRTQGSALSNAIRVLHDGKDLTPLSLVDEGTSLAVPKATAAGPGGIDKSGANIFASNTAGLQPLAGSSMKAGTQPMPGPAADPAEVEERRQQEQEMPAPQSPQLDGTDKGLAGVKLGDLNPAKDSASAKRPSVQRSADEEDALMRRGRLTRSNLEEDAAAAQIDLQEDIYITLDETPTETLFEMRGVCVGLDSADHRTVLEQNKKYEAMCAARAGSDLYAQQSAQTFNFDLKNAEATTGAASKQDTGSQITSWDIHDNNKRADEEEANDSLDDVLDVELDDDAAEGDEDKNADDEIASPDPDHDTGTATQADASGAAPKETKDTAAAAADAGASPGADEPAAVRGGLLNSSSTVAGALATARAAQVERKVAASLKEQNCLLPLSQELDDAKPPTKASAPASPTSPGQAVDDTEPSDALQADLREALRAVERGIQQNVYHDKHLLYRAVPFADAKSKQAQAQAQAEAEAEARAQVQQDGVPGGSAEAGAAGGAAAGGGAPGEGEEAVEGEEATGSDGVAPGAEGEAPGAGGSGAEGAEGSQSAEDEAAAARQESDVAKQMALDAQMQSAMEAPEQPELELLWKFSCEEVKGRTVSCMSWNKVNQDLLAVSYCQFEFAAQRDGLILFWTLKNPEFPERVIHSDSGVCSIDFSTAHPSLLAAGMYDGTIAIYDLNQESPAAEKPVLDTSRMPTQHKDAVWQVKWVGKSERGEVLVSLSTDGRVTEWSLKKGLASTDLMVLKRVHVPPELGGSGEGIISRTAAGLSLDFPVNDPGTYYASTEDGTIHRCSCSYNEQYLDTYFGHSGPVYKLRCSPFWPEVFLTCSADWSVKLWEPERDEPLMHFQSVDLADVVHDVAWSTSQSTVFGSVAGDGRIEIWDLAKNTLDPVVTRFISQDSGRGKARSGSACSGSASAAAASPPLPPGATKPAFFSTIAFAYNAPIVVAGSSEGVIHVYRARALSAAYDSEEEAADVLQQVVEQNQK